MSKTVKHYGRPGADGKLQAGSFMAALNELLRRRVPVVLTVDEFKETRSSQANRYYWGVVVELTYHALRASGIEITREGTHELLKFRFLKEDKPFGAPGEFITIVRSTTELERDEFAAYIERCKQFAAEYLNLNIPDPGEQVEMDMGQAA